MEKRQSTAMSHHQQRRYALLPMTPYQRIVPYIYRHPVLVRQLLRQMPFEKMVHMLDEQYCGLFDSQLDFIIKTQASFLATSAITDVRGWAQEAFASSFWSLYVENEGYHVFTQE